MTSTVPVPSDAPYGTAVESTVWQGLRSGAREAPFFKPVAICDQGLGFAMNGFTGVSLLQKLNQTSVNGGIVKIYASQSWEMNE